MHAVTDELIADAAAFAHPATEWASVTWFPYGSA